MQSIVKHKTTGHEMIVDGQLSDLLFEMGYRMVHSDRQINRDNSTDNISEELQVEPESSHNLKTRNFPSGQSIFEIGMTLENRSPKTYATIHDHHGYRNF